MLLMLDLVIAVEGRFLGQFHARAPMHSGYCWECGQNTL